MRFDVITLFPELFEPFFKSGINRRAFEGGLVNVRLWNLRDFAEGQYRRVDDRPFGGGPGMVMMAEPLWQCLQAVSSDRGDPPDQLAPVVMFTPTGERLSHSGVESWAKGEGAVLVLEYTDTVDGVEQTAERMIPFVSAYVDDVDRVTRRITVDWQKDY